MTDRTQPPPHVPTPSGFWSDLMGLANGYTTTGSNHTSVHFDAGGYAWAPSLKVGCIDRYRDPLSSNDPNGVRDLVWHNFDPWNPGAAQPNIPPPPPLPTPTDPLPGVPAIEVPAELACPVGYYRAVVGPDAGKCLPIGPGTTTPAPSPITPYMIRLHGGRYTVEGHFEPPNSSPLHLVPVGITDDACWLWALSPNNPELLVKVVGSNAGHVAPGVGGITNVAYTVTITDSVTGKVQTFTNAQGQMVGELRWDALPA